jgi:methionine synthase II (cobalamin-independent)
MGTTIKIKCIDQTLTYEGTPIVASGGVNEDYIQFEFGPLWDDFSKVAVFYRKKGEIYYGLVSTDNTVVVPKEVTEAKIADGRKSYPLKTKLRMDP